MPTFEDIQNNIRPFIDESYLKAILREISSIPGIMKGLTLLKGRFRYA